MQPMRLGPFQAEIEYNYHVLWGIAVKMFVHNNVDSLMIMKMKGLIFILVPKSGLRREMGS